MTSTYYDAEQVWTGTAQNWDRAVDYTYTADTLNRQSVTDNGVVTSYAPSALNQYQSNAETTSASGLLRQGYGVPRSACLTVVSGRELASHT